MADHQSPTTVHVTIRRNPHRSARPTASKTTSKPPPPLSPIKPLNPPNFDIDIKENPNPKIDPPISSNSLNVFLRIRPLPMILFKSCKLNSVKVKKILRSCITVNDEHSVTVLPLSCDSNRLKSEVYNGFSRVFGSDSTQDDVYEKMMKPIVEEFLNGRSGLLAALGPSGSGKTHTVFGSSKEPGLVPRALRHIFNLDEGKLRSFYLSIFEINSEKGKGEKLLDLSPDGSDIYMQQSVVKGLKEIPIKDLAEAESLLAHAKVKRATALTNSNSQSSRSQCIINIRCENKGEHESLPCDTLLTFVDLAGAEREKKTGNKGGRLLESNFINNTSMVFGLCLRSLLEHQKNPKKPLQKHFQSSLLTRYLRDYLEGRKRMALILSVRSGEEDYFDVSFLLRQASPYMEIKFHHMADTTAMLRNKRRHQTTGNVQHKRAKLTGPESRDFVGISTTDFECLQKEDTESIETFGGNKNNHVSQVDSLLEVDCADSNLQRQYDVMKGFAKALWVVLKQYKERIKVMQTDIGILTENLRIGHAQYMEMEKELLNFKAQCSCHKQVLCDFLTPAIGCQNTGSKGRVTGNSDLREESRSERDESLLDVPGSDNVSKIHLEDSANLQMSSPQSYPKAQIPVDFQISHGMRKSNSHDKDQKNVFNKDAAAHLAFSDVMDLSVQGNSRGSASPNEMDMENASNGLGSNINSELETKETNHSKPSIFSDAAAHLPCSGVMILLVQDKKCGSASPQEMDKENALSGLRSNLNSALETKETSHSKPSIFSDAAAHFPSSGVMGLVDHGKRCSSGSPNKMDKENACNRLERNFCSELKSKETRHSKPPRTSTNNGMEIVTSRPGRTFNSELETKEISHSKPSKAERPKRKLMPASLLLLRDASNIDASDFKGRSGRKLVEDEHKRSKGNASLMRLLKNHLPR